MIYHHFRIFIWICIVFGVGNPSILSTGRANRLILLHKIWTTVVIIAIILGYILTMGGAIDFSIKINLEQISNVNDLFVNVTIILVNLLNGEQILKNTYDIVNIIISDLNISYRTFKLISVKLHVWYSIPVITFLILINLEIISVAPPFILIIRIPTFLSILHLSIHVYLVSAVLKILNKKLSGMLMFNNIKSTSAPMKTSVFKYVIDPDITFIDDYQSDTFDLKLLCKIYDDISTYVRFLEDLHGLQLLLTIWLMFSSAVFGVTLIACHQANLQWLVIVRSILPFSWCFIGCYIDDRIRKEVGQTEILIIKYLIDYRCDQSRKNTLQTFRQLVSVNRLQFTACNLFDLNYSMILGTIMNVITYSIILVQLFLSE